MIIKIPKFFTTANIQIHNFNATFMCKRSIAGVPFDSAEHHSYAFSTTWGGRWCGGLYTNKQKRLEKREGRRSSDSFLS